MQPIDAQILYSLNQGIYLPEKFPADVNANKVIQHLARFKGISDDAVNLRMKAFILSDEDYNVLITGPSGHGKEILANAIAANASKVVIENMAAIPANLFESQLFGHKKGSFTGATTDFPGLIKYAHKGTLILDELAEMPDDTQAKLLRVIETGEFRPVGATETDKVDVRFIATTHSLNKLRTDLRWRLGEIHLKVSALSARTIDLQPISLAINKGNIPYSHTQDSILERVTAKDFGGVREIQSLINNEAFIKQEIELKNRYNDMIENKK